MTDIPASHGEKTNWIATFLICAFTLCTSVCGFFFTVFLKESHGYSGFQIGLLTAIQAVCGMLAAFPAGLGNDRFSSRALVGVSLLVMAVTLPAMAGLRLYPAFAAIYATWALSISVFRLSLDVQVLKSGHDQGTSRRLGIYHAGRFLGACLGTIGTGYLIRKIDFESTLWVVGAASLALLPAVIFLSRTPVGKRKMSDYRADLSSREVLLFAGWLFFFCTHWGAELTSYPLFLRTDLRLSLVEMGWYMSAEYVAITVAVLLSARPIREPENFRKFVILGLLASGAGMIGVIARPVALSLSFRVLHGFGDGVMLLVTYLGISRLFAVERIGGNAGFINLVTMAGLVAGSLFYGPLGERFGYGLTQWLAGGLILALSLPFLLLRDPGLPDSQTLRARGSTGRENS